MLKKKLGIEAIERDWHYYYLANYYKIPSTLIIPKSCRKIEHGAFWRCEKLEVAYIPKSIKKISGNAFGVCKNLKSIVCEEKVATMIKAGLNNELVKVSVISHAAMKNVLCFMQKVNTLTNRKV